MADWVLLLPKCETGEVRQILAGLGFALSVESISDRHYAMTRHREGVQRPDVAIVPLGDGPLPRPTLAAILTQAYVSLDDFTEALGVLRALNAPAGEFASADDDPQR